MNEVIKVENVSKLYNLQEVGLSTFKNDIARRWAAIRGKEDPAFALAESNQRDSKGNSRFVWALKDINFDVKQGEVLGIIGKNGAGKSTLLKILSRVAGPTTGEIKIKGRIASLLEVGTGFHPDLTGRENIFLNGSIMGMSKKEIQKNFDEIVDFSGVERYIDTPVKRYSSGMYVRLAFAVAAHLQPEILIVDEVLAVGDFEFQKKCMGKMKDVSGQGRTVLFVTHNMAAMQSLCTRTIYLQHGKLIDDGTPQDIIAKYIVEEQHICMKRNWTDNSGGNEFIRLKSAEITTAKGDDKIFIDTDFNIEIEFELIHPGTLFYVGLHFNTLYDETVFVSPATPIMASSGTYKAVCRVKGSFLNNKVYTLNAFFVNNRQNVLHRENNLLTFEILDVVRPEGAFLGEYAGNVRPQLDWSIVPLGNNKII